MNLSPNFTLEELVISETAARKRIDNKPGQDEMANLTRLAETLEEVRELLSRPIVITSGYRSRELNHAIGGSPLSVHCHGLAADFIAPPIAVDDICKRIATSDIGFDQLIKEYQWVHLGLSKNHNRRQILTKKGGGYITGIA